MNEESYGAAQTAAQPESDVQAIFNRQLEIYRKMVSGNVMFHREVYGLLRDLLHRQDQKPFRFLDIACGDASASSRALEGSAITHYFGIDLSSRSIELARQALKVLPCPVDLQCRDFAEAMAGWVEPVDIVWIGMSLHHLQSEGKARLIRNVHDVLSPGGMLLLWEPTLFDGETRSEWLARFSASRHYFSPLSDAEFAELESHMYRADFPESADTWTTMGRQAGFTEITELYEMPSRLGLLFKYSS